MATVTDVEVANASFPTVRQDLNDILEALATNFSADDEPSTTYANQFWYETDTNLLKMRNEANDAWITLAYLDQTAGEWEPRTAVIQAVDGGGLSFKTDEGTARVSISDAGQVSFENYSFPTADGTSGQALVTDGAGNLSFSSVGGEVVDDTTPQLGGDLSTNGNNINFGDNDKAQFGASNDLRIYHDGSNSYISDTGTGTIHLRSDGEFRVQNAGGTGNYIYAANGGLVRLYYNNSGKLDTNASGVTITGTCTATSFSGDGSGLTGVGGSTTFGAVGTYGFFVRKTSGATGVGSTLAGSNLMYGTQDATDRLSISNDINQGTDFRSYGQSGASSPSGTWRNMGSGHSKSSNTSDTSGRKSWNLYVRTA